MTVPFGGYMISGQRPRIGAIRVDEYIEGKAVTRRRAHR